MAQEATNIDNTVHDQDKETIDDTDKQSSTDNDNNDKSIDNNDNDDVNEDVNEDDIKDNTNDEEKKYESKQESQQEIPQNLEEKPLGKKNKIVIGSFEPSTFHYSFKNQRDPLQIGMFPIFGYLQIPHIGVYGDSYGR